MACVKLFACSPIYTNGMYQTVIHDVLYMLWFVSNCSACSTIYSYGMYQTVQHVVLYTVIVCVNMLNM